MTTIGTVALTRIRPTGSTIAAKEKVMIDSMSLMHHSLLNEDVTLTSTKSTRYKGLRNTCSKIREMRWRM